MEKALKKLNSLERERALVLAGGASPRDSPRECSKLVDFRRTVDRSSKHRSTFVRIDFSRVPVALVTISPSFGFVRSCVACCCKRPLLAASKLCFSLGSCSARETCPRPGPEQQTKRVFSVPRPLPPVKQKLVWLQ